MSKKQQTLFQSWHSGGKQQPEGNKPTKNCNNSVIDEVTLLDSDDDEGLEQAFEESLRNYYEKEKPRQQTAQHADNKPSTASSKSSSSYFDGTTAAESSIIVDSLPGFDNNSGNTWIYPTNKPVRKYQRDIVETCIFHNTLVTLPTGLGKTFIAAVVMYNFYRWYPQGKIIFLAPTKPLVAQQIQACYEIMGIPLECTSEMTGAMNPTDRKKQWREKRVFFLTPQVLANDISRSTCPATEVKCLVLDEAHKAQGSFAYVSVVEELCKLGAVFRILALSATPGGDIKAIQQVISNLHISKLEVRDEDSPDIQPYTHLRNIEKVIVPLGPEITQVRDTFLTMLSKYVEWLKNLGVLTQAVGSLTKGSVILARERFRKNPPGNFVRAQSGKAEGDFAMCITLTHALELLVQHGLRGFYNFLAEKTSVPEKGNNRTRTELYKLAGFSNMMDDLASKFGPQVDIGQAPVSHPKLTKLSEVVLEHFQRAEAEGRPTRVMIFSQFRDSVYEIVGLLEEYAPLVKAMKFVGHGNSNSGGKVKGFTQADQIRVIKEFTQGDYNTLVSTCVGEEGLDIGDVDMIICYDMHKSPVRLVQRCGRTGRKRNGRIVMLMAEGREEHTFNTSMYQKKNLVKVMNGTKLKEFLMTREPNLIPKHLTPRCHEMPMQVTEAFPVPASKQAKVTVSSKAVPVVRKTKITKCYYLSDAELEYYKNNLETNESIPHVPLLGHINTGDDPSTLKLDKFLPWQCNLQSRLNIEPSTLTSNFVEILQLIQEQQGNLYGSYHEQMTSFHKSDQENEPPSCGNITEVEHTKRFSSTLGKEDEYPVTASRGLYSPSFLNLFNPISVQFDFPDIPTPPPSIFAFSPDKHGAFISQSPETSFDDDSQTRPITPKKSSLPISTKQESEINFVENVTNTSDADMFQDSCSLDIDIDFNADNISIVIAKSPTKSERQNEIPETSFTVASPVLSQRSSRAKLPLKRKLDMDDSDLVFTPDKRPKTELPFDSNPLCQSKTDGTATEPDESILTVSQIVNLVSSPTTFFDDPSKQTIQPNFELEVDFIDSSQSESELDQLSTTKSSQNKVKQQLENSPPAVDVPESPILSKRRPAAESFVKADFSLGFNLSDLRDEDEEEVKENRSNFKYAVDNAAWDECFALSASDLEDIDEAAQRALPESTASTSTSSPFVVPQMDVKSRPSLPPGKKSPLWNSSGIRREIEDIFGGSQNVSEDSEILIVEPPKRPEPPMVILDSDNDQDFIEATPEKLHSPRHGTPPKAGNHTTAQSMLESDDEPSPLVPRRLNPRRNVLLQTQSTPIVRKRIDRVRSVEQTKKKKSARAFLDEEAELSLVDGSISDDEVLPQDDADQYEGSFVDDQASLNVSENMQAMYLRSVKSPLIQQNNFIFRQPAKPMNRSEIYSQAVVEEDEDYMLDSFCVGSEEDEDDEEMEHEDDHSESILLDETAATPVARRRPPRRRAPFQMEPARAENGRPRKRIISHPDLSSSDSDVATSPAKKLTVPAPKQETPPSPIELATPSSDRITSFATLSKEERLKKQREKQEEFRRSNLVRQTNLAGQSSGSMVPMSDRAPTTSINVPVVTRHASSTATASPPVRLLISSRQMATVGPIISTLHVQYKCLTHVCSFEVADFVLSSQLGIVRKLHSDFTNGSNRCRLQEQLRRLVALYDKPFLVIEGDRAPRDSRAAGDPSSVPDASSIIFKPNSPYFLQTCAALAQTELSILNSESQEHTARLLNDLARQESLKGFSLPKTENLSPKQDEFLKFLQRIQEINPGVALLMATQFKTFRELLNSSVETITERCKITADKARNIVQAFRVRR